MAPEKIEPIKLNVSAGDIRADAERYAALARENGVTDARPLEASKVPVDPRVSLKCSVPKCFGYGTSANCPPHCMKAGETQAIIDRYSWGVALSLTTAPEVIVRNKETILERVEAYKKIFELVSLVESAAFYDGYYLAVGFAAGSCKSTYCYNADCTVLQGEKCRLSLRARPSMEAVGIDCYRIAAELGWDIYPIGSGAESSCMPYGRLMGLVMVG